MKKLLKVNLILTGVALALIITAQTLHSSLSYGEDECPPCIPPRCLVSTRSAYDQYPHPYDNRWYYVCHEGEAHCLKCGDGLTYNPIEYVCDSMGGPGAGGECPNGGYWATGNREEHLSLSYEVHVTRNGARISLGFFATQRVAEGSVKSGDTEVDIVTVETTAYSCDNSNNYVCLVCNRYKL